MIRKYLEQFLELDEPSLCRVAFMNEALGGMLTDSERLNYYRQAVDEGRSAAQLIRGENDPSYSLPDLVARYGGTVTQSTEPPEEHYALFAYFKQPCSLVINSVAVERSEALVAEHHLSDLVGATSIADVLLCHEWYHLLASRDKAAFSQQRLLPLMGIGRFFRRRLACLEEIAAMSFAREMLDLPCSPYLYNILILYAFYPHQAERVLHDYLHCGEGS